MRRRRTALHAGLLLAALAAALPADAQVEVDAETQVRSIRFSGVKVFAEAELKEAIVTRDRGAAYGLRKALAALPVVDPPAPRIFSPIELQRDVVRLRRRYRDAGFLEARVRYEVERDPKENLIDIVFRIEQGPPARISATSIAGPDSVSPVSIPDSLARSWRSVETSVARLRGDRLDMAVVRKSQERIRGWWRDRGHPSAEAPVLLDVDSVRHEASVRFVVLPGAPARFGPITIAGSPSISAHTILRELPFQEGDPYSAAALSEGRTELQQFEIVRTASFDISTPAAGAPAGPAPGQELPVSVKIFEARPRMMTGAVGYDSDAGCSAEARWGHRNFAGAGRTLTFSAVAQTGWLALAENPDVRYRATLSLLQPYFLSRRMSGVVSPFVEQRDDATDRSLEYGSNFTVILRSAPSRSASLDYRLSRRRIYEYRLEDVTGGDVDLLTLLSYASQGFLDSLGTTLNNSVLTLSGRLGVLDQATNPRRGWLFRPAVQLTAPPGATSSEYWRVDATLYGFLPIRRIGVLTGRIGGGRLLPFGKSLPNAEESPAVKLLQLRDVLETAGGSEDVRGWGYRMLGPKFPDIRFGQDGDTAYAEVDGYVPLGALSQSTFSVDLRLPVPGMGPRFGSRIFLDGGRVWTGDDRFDTGTDPYGQEDWFYSTGAGLDLITPVGPIRLSLAYKLNPSLTDLVDAADLLAARRSGQPIESLPREQSRRWQIHFAIGTGL